MKIKTHIVVGISCTFTAKPETLNDLAAAKTRNINQEKISLLQPMLKGKRIIQISNGFVKSFPGSNSFIKAIDRCE